MIYLIDKNLIRGIIPSPFSRCTNAMEREHVCVIIIASVGDRNNTFAPAKQQDSQIAAQINNCRHRDSELKTSTAM